MTHVFAGACLCAFLCRKNSFCAFLENVFGLIVLINWDEGSGWAGRTVASKVLIVEDGAILK
jgi:hypothetical protein